MEARSATTRRPRRHVSQLILAAVLVATACTNSADSSRRPTAEVAPTATAVPALSPTPTAAPTAGPSPEPTATPVAPFPGVNAIGNLAPAPPGTYVTAKPEAGFLLDNGAYIVPVYDMPGGPPRALVDSNGIDGVVLTFPLRNPTVLGQPLVLRVIAEAPGDEWLLVQAPVRPHRQHIWVRADDFILGQTDMRIEVDLGRDGRFALFNGEQEMINSPAVYGRESRPTVLHDTYVEQALAGFNPAYGTYVLTIASYSQTLGSYGGGGLPGQSIHGTNQPELVGQRVSSGGIRVPNEVIEFVYAQPGIIGASVIIYDSTGIGRDAAIALQRNARWFGAATTAFDEANFAAVPMTSYS